MVEGIKSVRLTINRVRKQKELEGRLHVCECVLLKIKVPQIGHDNAK